MQYLLLIALLGNQEEQVEVQAPCPSCPAFGEQESQKYSLRVNQEGCIPTSCESGHAFAVVIQNLRHELLFDMGLFALKAGYPREAVVNFASSYEELCRFFVQVALSKAGLPDADSIKVCKSIRLSERSLGAFVAVYALTKTSPAPVLRDEQWAFRNRVVHQGEIPSDEAVHAFGDGVLECSIEIQNVIQSIFPKTSRDLATLQIEERCRLVSSGTFPIAHHLNTALDHLRVEDAPFRTSVTNCLVYLKNAGGNQGGFSYQIPENGVIPNTVPPPVKVFMRFGPGNQAIPGGES